MVNLTKVRQSIAERSNESNFDGVKIPFFIPENGTTRLHFLSDLDLHESEVPPITFYHYYKPATPINKGNYQVYEIAYKKGDTLEPSFLADKNKKGKKVNTDNFPIKGFAYVINLTALKAIRLFNERGGDLTTNVDAKKDPIITSKDFGGVKFANEAKAAKSYIKQYQKRVLAPFKDSEDGIPDFHGIFIYNFNVSITKGIASFIDTLEADGEELENIKLTDWVFALTKEGSGLDTEYSLSIDYPSDEIEDGLEDAPHSFLNENDELSDFEGLVDRKRYKTDDDELEEEYKVSTVEDEDEEEEWS